MKAPPEGGAFFVEVNRSLSREDLEMAEGCGCSPKDSQFVSFVLTDRNKLWEFASFGFSSGGQP